MTEEVPKNEAKTEKFEIPVTVTLLSLDELKQKYSILPTSFESMKGLTSFIIKLSTEADCYKQKEYMNNNNIRKLQRIKSIHRFYERANPGTKNKIDNLFKKGKDISHNQILTHIKNRTL